jgi:eukaryotic-like serine/threonine-protein kinase
MSHQPDPIYEFGPFRLDVAERMLLRGGEAIPLQQKAFDLLHILVEYHGHLLEKDEVLKVVWPDTIVEEVKLANNISVLRKALGEDGNGQRFIETVPRRGYRFVAGVRQIQQATVKEDPPIAMPVAAPLSPTMPRAVPERSGQWRRLALALASSGTIIIALVAWFYFNRSPVLTENDTILLADFENKTGEEIFDKTLKVGLAIQLQQSPFLNLFPEARVRHALTIMKQYLRGQAYLKLRRGSEAAAEFQKVLDNRGHAPLSPLYQLARLGLARAALASDTAMSRRAYRDFFDLWKVADPDLPILRAARQEHEHLKP